MKYNDALTVLRDFVNNFDIDRLKEAVDIVVKTKGFDPPLPDFEDMFGILREDKNADNPSDEV